MRFLFVLTRGCTTTNCYNDYDAVQATIKVNMPVQEMCKKRINLCIILHYLRTYQFVKCALMDQLVAQLKSQINWCRNVN